VVRAFAQPGQWLGPVTRPGWLGPAQPMWAELGPAQKNEKKKTKKNRKVKEGRKNKKKMCMHE